MRYILRMTLPANRTTRSDVLEELVNPTVIDLRDKLSELLRMGDVSCLITKDDGSFVYYAHDLCYDFAAHLKEVCLCTG